MENVSQQHRAQLEVSSPAFDLSFYKLILFIGFSLLCSSS